MRLGHYQFIGEGSDNTAPELVSYLDLTVGRWENYQFLDNTLMRVRRPWRFAAEGRLRISKTPLQVGFDVNAGDGPDDVRFLFGTTFDIGKLFEKLREQ